MESNVAAFEILSLIAIHSHVYIASHITSLYLFITIEGIPAEKNRKCFLWTPSKDVGMLMFPGGFLINNQLFQLNFIFQGGL